MCDMPPKAGCVHQAAVVYYSQEFAGLDCTSHNEMSWGKPPEAGYTFVGLWVGLDDTMLLVLADLEYNSQVDSAGACDANP